MTWAQGEVVRCGGPVAGALESSRLRVTSREGLWLKLTDGQGRTGIGECAPLPGYSPETLTACREALGRWLETRDDALPSAARCAVQGALLDLRGQQTGKPAHLLLAMESPAPVPLAALVADIAEARRMAAAGLRTLKLKIGCRPFEAELRLLHELRREVGPDIALRLDANGAFSPAEVRDRLRALAELDPELVEEPASEWTEALVDSPVPLALDESLQGGFDGRLASLASVAVLKPMLLGGPNTCLALAEQLISAGLDLVVSHTWDGPVGLATAATTALAIGARWPGRLRACGLTRHAGLSAWPERELPCLGSAELRPNALPGLGLTTPEIA